MEADRHIHKTRNVVRGDRRWRREQQRFQLRVIEFFGQ
jgi:hypothetical protein